MDNIIEIKGLKKDFGVIHAVNDLSFDVAGGSLFAFLGLNGAGKSTTINILCSLLHKDAGSVKICGYDLDAQPDKIRANIGIVFQGSVLDKTLSVWDNLAVRASYYGIFGDELQRRKNELGQMLGLDELWRRPYGKLSGGQRRRVDVARGILHEPKLLFLDEPTTGLDPQSRQMVWSVLNELRKKGMTIFLTTHYMEEANSADHVIILDEGKIAAQGSPVELKDRYSADYIKLYQSKTAETDQVLEDYSYVYENNAYKVKMLNGSEDAKKFILAHQKWISDFEVTKGDMDDVFLTVTGKKLLGGEQA